MRHNGASILELEIAKRVRIYFNLKVISKYQTFYLENSWTFRNILLFKFFIFFNLSSIKLAPQSAHKMRRLTPRSNVKTKVNIESQVKLDFGV